jgi:hypothetical protein
MHTCQICGHSLRDEVFVAREMMLGLREPFEYVECTGKFAWREFGTDWVQLDAPRHLFLHTEKSIRILAQRTGFAVREITYDSSAFQFWGSEQYRQGIPLHDKRSYLVDRRRSPFTRREIAAFEKRATELNSRGDGDQGCFYLVRGIDSDARTVG